MNIGYDAKRAFCNNSGLGNYSRGVICGEARTGDGELFLYTPRVKGRFEHFFEESGRLKVVAPQGLWRLAPSVWRSVGIGPRLAKDGVGIFHGLSHELPYFVPKGVKTVVTMHDLIVRRFPEYFKPADRLIHRLKQSHACRVADIVVAISEQTKRDLVDMMHVPEEKIRVVYQSCDPIFWDEKLRHPLPAPRYRLPAKYILCVGTLEERKNQLTVINAMNLLPDELSLVVVGRPRGKYGRQVVESQNGRVRVLSGVDFKDFPSLYAHAVASVYLSRFEGFGIPILESMCCDCPVVTSKLSSMPEAGGDAALYADPDDTDTVASHLQRLFTDEAFRQERIEIGRLQRMKFAPDKIAADLQAVYEELVAGSR